MTATAKVTVISVMVADLKGCAYSRAEVALRLTEIAGFAVTENNIDAWTARTKPHRFPAELIPAWVHVTGSTRLLEALCESAGLHAADETDRKFAELGRAHLERERADERVRELKGDLWPRH